MEGKVIQEPLFISRDKIVKGEYAGVLKQMNGTAQIVEAIKNRQRRNWLCRAWLCFKQEKRSNSRNKSAGGSHRRTSSLFSSG